MDEAVTKLIEATAAVYAGCRSYRDEGEVVTVTIHSEPRPRRRTSIRPFKTRFVRPDLFRFEYRDQTVGPESEWDRCVVVRQGTEVRSYWSIGPQRPVPESLARALAGATGVSGSSAHRIPRLLLPEEITGRHPLESVPWELGGEEILEGELCARLSAAGSERDTQVWIGRQTGLIRRVFEKQIFNAETWRQVAELHNKHRKEGQPEMPARGGDDFVAETTTFYRPELNGVIEVSEFDREM